MESMTINPKNLNTQFKPEGILEYQNLVESHPPKTKILRHLHSFTPSTPAKLNIWKTLEKTKRLKNNAYFEPIKYSNQILETGKNTIINSLAID